MKGTSSERIGSNSRNTSNALQVATVFHVIYRICNVVLKQPSGYELTVIAYANFPCYKVDILVEDQ
jgi:hypothetical protein